MPRKTPAQRKDASGGVKTSKASKKTTRAVAKDEEDGNQDAERSRRSSTAAQTAASVAESRVTRSRHTKSSSSSAEGGKHVEAPISRSRSSRRSAQNVNYKESDGEEESQIPKNEEDFESNEEFEDSDSDEKSKKKTKKGKSPQKGRVTKPKGRAPKSGKRGRAARKKKESDEEDEEEEEETVDLSDSSVHGAEAADTLKKEDKSEKSPSPRRKPRVSTQPSTVDLDESDEKSEKSGGGRRSRRASAKSSTEPVAKRPSRNKQIKKYTEVDEEDFSDVKSEEEYEPELKKENRKRKREVEVEPNKRQRREKPVVDLEKEVGESNADKSKKGEEKIVPEEEKKKKVSEDIDADQSSDEPMEIDESVSDDESKEKKDVSAVDTKSDEKTEKKKTSDEDIKEKCEDTVSPSSEPADDIESKSTDEKSTKEKSEPDKTDVSTPVECSEPKTESKNEGSPEKPTEPEVDVPTPANVETQVKPVPVVPVEEDVKKNESKSEVVVSQSNDNTFLSKEHPVPAAVNGEDGKSNTIDDAQPKDAAPSTEPVFEHQNDTVTPKTNGAQDELDDSKRTLAKDSIFVLPNRQYVFNVCIDEALRASLKEGTFGIISYNLSSGVVNKDKLIHELDKLQASIICLQEVTRSFFVEALESKLDVLGYKAVTNNPWSDSGLVTFYKSSLFSVCDLTDTSTQDLISRELEKSNFDESEKQAVSGCFDKCGNVLITQLASVHDGRAVTVANVRIPPCSMSLNALQVSCVAREITKMRKYIKPVLICGEFNVSENEVPYQLMKNGYLSNRMVEELKSRTDGSECAALIKLLQIVSDTENCAMNSCYSLVLGKELEIPKSKGTCPDLMWASADNLHIIGILGASTESSDVQSDHRISLKADVAFSV